MAAGPVGEALTRYPLYYAKAAFFGGRPPKTETTRVNNGTITFLQLENGVIGVTCAHVIQGFRQMQSDLGKALFQIGNVELDPLDQLIAEHKDFDLATISLSANQLKLLLAEGEIGFPGALRERENFDELTFGTFSAAGISVVVTQRLLRVSV